MSIRKTTVQVLRKVEPDFEGESYERMPVRKLISKSLNDLTLKERIVAASKPLYLKRYE